MPSPICWVPNMHWYVNVGGHMLTCLHFSDFVTMAILIDTYLLLSFHKLQTIKCLLHWTQIKSCFILGFQVWSNFLTIFNPEYRRITYMMMAVWFPCPSGKLPWTTCIFQPILWMHLCIVSCLVALWPPATTGWLFGSLTWSNTCRNKSTPLAQRSSSKRSGAYDL